MSRVLKLMLGTIAVLSLVSCGSSKEKVVSMVPVVPLDTELSLEFNASDNINPDDNGVPSPLFIRMYELKSDKAFLKAGFLDVYEKDKQLLANDLVAKHELKHLIPSEFATSRYKLAKETVHVGIYAEFLQYKNAEYKIVAPVIKKIDGNMRLVVSVSGNTIRVEPPAGK